MCLNKLNSFLAALIFIFLLFAVQVYGQTEKVVDLKDISIQFWDNEAAGTPLVFIHSDSRDLLPFLEFSKNFNSNYRTIVYSRRGYEKSSGDYSSRDRFNQDTEDLLRLLDYLKIEKAVFIGNLYGGAIMTKLAEEYPQRIIAQIYLAGNVEGIRSEILKKDSFNAIHMMTWAQKGKEAADKLIQEYSSFNPGYLEKKQVKDFPALTFLNYNNTRGTENINGFLMFSKNADKIKFEEPQKFFSKILKDTTFKNDIVYFQQNTVKPFLIKDAKLWIASLPSLQIVQLEKPFISGYEFERETDLILPSIKEFLTLLK